ncbi:MAG: ABC transporter permease subunit [Alphaproteobacteria bacterium]|nr:ABC transporter permease subunit [Alphaproteobacteria bacterium]
MKVRRFLLRRMVMILPLLVGILFFTFMLVRIGGQDPVGLLAGPTATQAEIDMITRDLGLDQPLFVQFGYYLANVLQGDLGESWLSNREVVSDIAQRIPVTLELLLWGVGIGALIGIPVGLRAAFRPDGTFDQISRFLSLLGFSIPTYWLGLVMLFVFFYLLGWAPPGIGRIGLIVIPPEPITGSYLIDGLLQAEWEAARSAASHLILPVICVAIVAAAPIIKHTRAIALEVVASDTVRYARASGLPEAIVRKIVLRNSTVPVMTFVGTELTGLVGTVSLIEYVFAWGGLGQYGLNAIVAGDFAAVQGYVLVLALFSVVVFLIIDLLVVILEPRASEQP